jgi:hypothetical protein
MIAEEKKVPTILCKSLLILHKRSKYKLNESFKFSLELGIEIKKIKL